MEGHVELWQNFWHFSVSAFEMFSRFFAFGLQMCHCSPELLDLLTWSGNKQRSKHNNLVSIRIFERIVFKKIVNAKSVRSRGWSVGVSCTCVIAAECLHNLRGGFCTTTATSAEYLHNLVQPAGCLHNLRTLCTTVQILQNICTTREGGGCNVYSRSGHDRSHVIVNTFCTTAALSSS